MHSRAPGRKGSDPDRPSLSISRTGTAHSPGNRAYAHVCPPMQGAHRSVGPERGGEKCPGRHNRRPLHTPVLTRGHSHPWLWVLLMCLQCDDPDSPTTDSKRGTGATKTAVQTMILGSLSLRMAPSTVTCQPKSHLCQAKPMAWICHLGDPGWNPDVQLH